MRESDSHALGEAVEVVNREGTSPVLLLCEHASSNIPARYNGLGLRDEDRLSHAAWDPGARAVALHMAQALDAPLVASRVSRLVYDCNRPPEAASAMPEKSELVAVPGNFGLSEAERQERADTVYVPFCTTVTEVIEARKKAGLQTVLVTMHSFTPVYFGKQRDVEIGILHDADSRLADAMLAEAPALPHRRVERNEPYGPADGVTHSLKLHGLAHGLANVMIEIRNDLVATPDQEEAMAQEMLTLLRPALAALAAEGGPDA
ncbi:N-formylglutamate amidohydrolase [Leisingera aquaemixtae]|uniref:N-formylglutamate amidohydrolase n=1 Tax=Leisingera aquaemixtae TaxID=1396826 RepID=UPI0021A69B2E|nr:N-formylglutamate amidohydrolase [Leisingera aquaemixtae]UWQ38165.1 N-formylglutamate amidohydrolase [Leisingera aquaemixtae]UWQ46575.1 N-formylglutamate amidohydrolase [Leisingera aquaemixtae]